MCLLCRSKYNLTVLTCPQCFSEKAVYLIKWTSLSGLAKYFSPILDVFQKFGKVYERKWWWYIILPTISHCLLLVFFSELFHTVQLIPSELNPVPSPPIHTLLWNNRLETFSHDIENSLENISQLCIYCSAIIYLIFNFCGGHFRLISSFAKVNNAVVNIFVLKSLFIFCIISWGWIPRNGITE